jgi:putative oxidoreductase
MLRVLLRTDNAPERLWLRLVLGALMFAHGAQKLFGWFGGYGFGATMQHFTQQMHIPPLFAFLAIMAESVGSVALICGFLTRVAAFGISVNMIVAVAMVHWKNGLFMNWSGNQAGEGFEYHLLVLAITAVLLIQGGGFLSVDRAWFCHLQRENPPHDLSKAGRRGIRKP